MMPGPERRLLTLFPWVALLSSLSCPLLASGQAAPLGPEIEGNAQAPRWSPDGSQIAWEVNYHDRKRIELYVLAPGTGAPREVRPTGHGASALTAGFTTASSESVTHELAWAPASLGRFVYSASTAEHDYDIYIDGTGAIAHSSSSDGGPVWSPDGRYIAFTSSRSGQGDLYLIDTWAIDMQPKRITSMPTSSELYPAWAPNSRLLAFVAHNSEGDSIYLMDVFSDDPPMAVTRWGHTQTRPSFSPDGVHMAFYSNHEDPKIFDLYAIVLGESAKLVASDVVLNEHGPSFSPLGTSLLYVKNDDAHFSPVWAAPIDAPEKAHPVQTGTVGNGDLDVTRAPDGRTWLAVAAQGLTGDQHRGFRRIYTMELPDLP
jgi:Tol biopolymer transport system component